MAEPITTSRASAPALLDWYDRHHREMPWRVSPADRKAGVKPDPYRIWLSEVMLQQTTVAAVREYFRKFTTIWPDVHALAAAPREAVLEAWAGLGYYARARNLHACAAIVSSDLNGLFPDTEEELRKLPGIGPYTSAAIAAIAFDRRATVLDGNVERVMSRLYAIEEPLPDSKLQLRNLADALTPENRPGDYAQAVMDLGATICTPRRPACALCPWRGACEAAAMGIAETLPRKRPKARKPVRQGRVWVAFDEHGHVLTQRRADKGLLGGMLAMPTKGWDGQEEDAPPVEANWQDVGEVRHTFTHFHLILRVEVARVPEPREGWLPVSEAKAGMPTVFAKALGLAESAFTEMSAGTENSAGRG